MSTVFFPSAELICDTINVDQAGSLYRSFLLSEICSPPFGLVWLTKVGFAKLKESVQALLGCAYKPFILIMDALESRLQRVGFLPPQLIRSIASFLPAATWRKELQPFRP
jgi:hypothetical protein